VREGTVVDTGKVAIEWLIGLPGHEVLTSTGVGPEMSVVIAEKALGIDVNMRWANEAIYRQHWLTNALNRMKDDGYLDPNMTYSQFLDWLKAGNKITLKQLDAIDAATGRPPEGRFNNIEVEKIVVLMTRLNPQGSGEPALPIEGRTRFSVGMSDGTCYDTIYYPDSKVMYLVWEINSFVSLNEMSSLVEDVASAASHTLREPASVFDSDQTTTSSSGRIVNSGEIYHIDRVGRLLNGSIPIRVVIVK
jgi:hypothetical protein